MTKELQTYVRVSARLVILIGLLVLIGWQFRITVFKSVFPGLIAMNPFTALALMGCAVWQLLRLNYGARKSSRAAAAAFAIAGFVFVIGLIKLFERTGTGLDYMLFQQQIGLNGMSQLTAFCLVLFGALMLLSGLQTRNGNLVVWFTAPVFALSVISLFGYFIGNNSVGNWRPCKPMALHSTLCSLALILNYLVLFPRNAITQIVLRADSGGYIARSLLPYVVLMPLLIGYLDHMGELYDYYDSGFGVAVFVVASILIFLFIVVRQMTALSEVDQERKAARKRAEKHALDLQRRNKELEQFTYAASHDMQEPLRKIMVFANLLTIRHATQLDERGNGYVAKIHECTALMKHITEGLRDYAQHTGSEEIFVTTDLNEVVKAVEADLEMSIRETGATVRVEPLPQVRAVPAQMHQLFYNLIGNALKFTRPGVAPVLQISCRHAEADLMQQMAVPDKNGSYVQIQVADNGIGFRPEYAGKIFNLFTRLHDKSKYGGTGIGLALCKKVVENHQGLIQAEGKPGEGAVFSVLLPDGQRENEEVAVNHVFM